MTVSVINASADQTLDQTSDTLVDSMTLTPAAGDYLVIFTGYLDNGATAKNYEVSIYVGGAIVQHTERAVDVEGSVAVAGVMSGVATHAHVSVNGSQAIEVRYRRTSGTTASTMKRRTMTLFPKASADFQQATATGDATVSATTDTLLTGMSITPGAGTYLLVFSASADNAAAGISLFHSVYVNNAKLNHTEREFWAEASISANLGAMPCLLACLVSPGAGQAVEIRSRRVTNNWTVHERTLTLMKVDAADIKEATATADATGTGVSYESMSATPLQVTDPGAADWLAIFSTSQRYGTITADQHTDYSIFIAGSQDANTERRVSQENSIDNADYYGFTHGRVTVAGAADDVEIKWKGATSATRTAKERTFVLVRSVESGISATLDATEEGDAIASATGVLVSGTLAANEQDDALTAAGSVLVTAAGELAEQDDAINASAGVLVSATLSVIEDGDTLAATATNVAVASATLELTEESDVLAAAGQVSVAGTFAQTEQDDIAAAAGSIIVSATLQATETDDIVTADGSVLLVASLSAIEEADALSATAATVAVVNAELQIIEADDVVAAAAAVMISASAAILEQDDGISAAAAAAISASAQILEEGDIVVSNGAAIVAASLAIREEDDRLLSEAIIATERFATLAIVEEDDALLAAAEITGPLIRIIAADGHVSTLAQVNAAAGSSAAADAATTILTAANALAPTITREDSGAGSITSSDSLT